MFPEPNTAPDIAEILLAALGTAAAAFLGYIVRRYFPQWFSQPTKTVVTELPKSDNGDLSKQKDALSYILAEGVIRSHETLERLLVQSMALNEQYQVRIDEFDDREADSELVIAELKRRLDNCQGGAG